MHSETGGADMDRVVAQLIEDFRAVVAEGEALLQASVTGEEADGWAHMRTRLGGRLASARARLTEVEDIITRRARAATVAVDTYVHDRPWTAVLLAAGMGLVAGYLLLRQDEPQA